MQTATTQRRRLFHRAAIGGALIIAFAFVVVGSGIASSAAKPVNTSPPKIVGAARVGQTLTGDRGTWTNSPTKYDLAWLRCDTAGGNCALIGGATGTTYTLTSADDGHTLRFRVAATNADGTTVATSAQTATVVAAGKPTNTSTPTISGAAQEGVTLTGSNGTWTNSPTRFDLSWLRCDKSGGSCASIGSANKGTYTLTSADVGNTVRFRVTATNSAGSNVATSAATAVVSRFRGNGCPRAETPTRSRTSTRPRGCSSTRCRAIRRSSRRARRRWS